MTFQIAFTYKEVPFRATVTPAGKDFLVNLTTPVQYETTPTMVFTLHEDETMAFNNDLFDDPVFMNTISSEITNHLHKHKISIK